MVLLVSLHLVSGVTIIIRCKVHHTVEVQIKFNAPGLRLFSAPARSSYLIAKFSSAVPFHYHHPFHLWRRENYFLLLLVVAQLETAIRITAGCSLPRLPATDTPSWIIMVQGRAVTTICCWPSNNAVTRTGFRMYDAVWCLLLLLTFRLPFAGGIFKHLRCKSPKTTNTVRE